MEDLILINYEVKPEILKKHVPFGTELDIHEGKCYLSLVGFLFLNTKVLGIKIPYHINFEEVNLRFYVKRLENNEKHVSLSLALSEPPLGPTFCQNIPQLYGAHLANIYRIGATTHLEHVIELFHALISSAV